MKYIGIDYGSKRVGVAISDDGGAFAFPLVILANDTTLVESISALCEKNSIAAIVLGESHDLSGNQIKLWEVSKNLNAT